MTDVPQPPAPPSPPVPSVAPSAPPEQPIGAIVDPAAQTSGLMNTPTAEQLAAFPPPPPIVASAAAPSNEPEQPGFPQAPAQAMYPPAFASVAPNAVPIPTPQPVAEVAVAPIVPKRFHELGPRTQDEIRYHWHLKHPGMEFPADTWEEPIGERPTQPATGAISEPDHAAIVEIERQPVKVSQKTLDEMSAGKAALDAKKAEQDRVRALQAKLAAESMGATNSTTQVSNLDYVEQK